MLTWPNGNCDSKNCVNIPWHLQVDNVIIFLAFSLLLNKEDIDMSSKDASCDQNYVHSPSLFVLITPKYEYITYSWKFMNVFPHMCRKPFRCHYIQFLCTTLWPTLTFFCNQFEFANKIISTSELWWVLAEGERWCIKLHSSA